MMRGVVYRGPGKIEVDTGLDLPRVRHDRDAVVRVTRTAICGTDLHPYRGEMPGFRAGTVLGHEFTGVVTETGSGVPFAVGRRVVVSDIVACGRCDRCLRGRHYHCPDSTLFGYDTVAGAALPGGQADYVRVPFADVVLSPSPDDLTDDQLLFVGDILSTAYIGAESAGITPGDVVGVVGAGPVGLLAAQCARVFGAARVVVTDTDARRRAKTAELGFDAVEPEGFGPALGAGSDRGAAAVIEAVGSPSALTRALTSIGYGGTVVAVGSHGSTAVPLDAKDAFAREATLRFAVGNPIRVRDRVIALLRAGLLDPAPLVSHRLPLSDAARAYRLFDERKALKVVLSPGEDRAADG
ncbi:alcohol dehydrogenase catalytic domain-containing protein [Streptomyces sp. NPDC058953]|uniref:alcohol dehydrogenase catalytic domain-containing protein n=1 Tax=unclassified Streptomyces TaxID=2593676 RepID=UPI00369CD948